MENLQTRVRGIILMAVSNQDGHLVLTTGDDPALVEREEWAPASPQSRTNDRPAL